MNDIPLVALVRETDAYASHTPLPESTWSREAVLHEIERRRGMSIHETTSEQVAGGAQPPATKRSKRSWSPALAGGLAFIAIVVAIAAFVGLRNDGQDAGTNALSVADEYFDAFNAGDTASVMALFSDDAQFGDRYVGGFLDRAEGTEPNIETRFNRENRFIWFAAMGSNLTTPECAVVSDDGQEATVSCAYGTRSGLVKAVEAPDVPTVTHMVITEDGIRSFIESYGSPDFFDSYVPFATWMQGYHPDEMDRVLGFEFDEWSRDVSREHGALMAQYAEKWATFLAENGCAYNDGCL